jgi:hypothetical protein
MIVISSMPNAFIFGNRETGDKIIQEQFINIKWNFFRIRHKFITFYGDKKSTITQIKIDQNAKYTKGATVWINNGGIGYKYANIGFRSTKTSGIHFIVTLYGKKKK